MKKVKGILTLMVVMTAMLFSNQATAQSNETNGIQFFHGTWEEALAEAKKQDKLIFLDAYASWCGPCKMMAKNTFPKKKAGEYYNKNFINVKMDMEKGEGPALASKLGINAYPTLFYINSGGKIVLKELGYRNVDDLIETGGKALDLKR